MKKIKHDLLLFLKQEKFDENLPYIHNFKQSKALNALLSFLYSTDAVIKDRAITSIGEIVSKMAENDIEDARIVLRRLMVTLTEESGGIGWGAPLAFGEILARNKQLAEEFHLVLISYALEESKSYLDYIELQKEVLAGLRRMSEVHPNLMQDYEYLLET